MAPSRSRRIRWVLLVVLGLAVMLVIVPLALPRYPAVASRAEPYPPEELAAEFDQALLREGVSDRTVVEIDWVEGCEPGPQAIAGLEAILKKYSPPNHAVEIVVDQEIPRAAWRYALLWIDLDRLERMTLIHEFGHLFGLVGNPRHERSAAGHRGHCNDLHCLTAHPTLRVIARNFAAELFNQFMTDYCDACQGDIRRTQAYWRASDSPAGSR